MTIRLTASSSDIKLLAKKYNTTQILIREALSNFEGSIGLWSGWEEKIGELLWVKEYKRKHPER